GDNIYSPEQTTVTLNANNPTIGTGLWSVRSGSGGSFTDPYSYNSNFTGNNNETYILRWRIGYCVSSDDEVTVFIGNVIGQYRHGGVIFYIDETGEHGLVCTVSDQSTGIIWGDNELTGATGTAIGTGQTNTSAIVTTLGAGSYAAQVCNDLTLNGYNDWFLPSIDELNAMHQNSITISSTSMDNGGNAFASNFYWSSTETGSSWAIAKSFSDYDPGIFKSDLNGVRAVRVF
ncbi:MAG: Lcl domain-containing protein, partial [Candidatus Heimdallarchaeota archaeon]